MVKAKCIDVEVVSVVLMTILLTASLWTGIGHVAASDDAFFDVEIVETNAPITEGETLVVTVRVTNTGNAEDSQQIHLKSPEHEILDSIADPPLTLAPGESEQVTLEWTSSDGDAGTGDFSVQSNDDFPDVTVVIEEDTSENGAGSGQDTSEGTSQNANSGGGNAAAGDANGVGVSLGLNFPDGSGSVENSPSSESARIDEVLPPDPTVVVPIESASSGGMAVTEVTATFNMGTTVDNTLRVETSESPPTDASAPNDVRAFGYVSADVEGNLHDRVTEGTVTIELDRSELADVALEDASAWLYRDGEWQSVETRPENETALTVVTPGFSVVAIGTSESE